MSPSTITSDRIRSDWWRPLYLAVLATFLLPCPRLARAWTRTVCPSGCAYSSINAAVNDPNPHVLGPGDIVNVLPGVYRERVRVDNRDGTAAQPAIIKADIPGSAIVEGTILYTDPAQWTPLTPGSPVYAAYLGESNWDAPRSRVFSSSGVPYTFMPANSKENLQPGQYTEDGAAGGWAYVNAGGNPGSVQVAITTFASNRQRAFEVENTDHVIIDGFTVQGCAEHGIRIRSTPANVDTNLRGIVIKNNIARLNFNRGIAVENCAECAIENNTAHGNDNHGIYLHSSTRCKITRNHSFLNNKYDDIWGGIAGIRIGDSPSPNSVTYVSVDFNDAHNNEDSGIDIRGASHVVVRRNLSYRNGDHGIDNNPSVASVFMNNVVTQNGHDGLSIENGSSDLQAYNNIFAFNALTAPPTPENVGELFVKGSGTSGFESNHNLIIGLPPGNVFDDPQRLRVFAEFGADTFNTLTSYQATTGRDLQSVSGLPMFVDSAGANFLIGSVNSKALDRARTDMTADPSEWTSPWWLPVDLRGFIAHDVCDSIVGNGGAGSPAYADIGAYEYDPKPGNVTDVRKGAPSGTHSVMLLWTATRDDSTVGCKVDSADVRYATAAITTEQEFQAANRSTTVLVPVTPGSGNQQSFEVTGLATCSQYHFAVKVRADENGLWSDLGVKPFSSWKSPRLIV